MRTAGAVPAMGGQHWLVLCARRKGTRTMENMPGVLTAVTAVGTQHLVKATQPRRKGPWGAAAEE